MTLKQARHISGLTQSALAEKIGVGRATVANWERGISKPTINNVKKIVSVFGINASELSFFSKENTV